MAWKIIEIYNADTFMVWNFEKDPTHVGTNFFKESCEGQNKNSSKGICRFGKINHFGNERKIKKFIDGQDMKQYQVLIFKCIA